MDSLSSSYAPYPILEVYLSQIVSVIVPGIKVTDISFRNNPLLFGMVY